MGRPQESTVAALATGVGGSIAIVRISGPEAMRVADAVWRGPAPLAALGPRVLTLGRIVDGDGQPVDHCLAVRMPAPNSYTGEDCVELQCHGGPLISQSVVSLLLAAGAEAAGPGEFTKRAFLNGKLDLTQAEAVLDLINARSQMALHAANRQLQGRLGQRVEEAYEQLSGLLAEVESRLDFADEELDWTPSEALAETLETVLKDLGTLRRSQREGTVLRHGVRMVLAGAPNAGKSTLLNCILGHERAIVTELPGTTRDTLEENIEIRGIPFRVIDTAGLRQAADPLEQHGIARTLSSLAEAQVVLWVVDITIPFARQRPPPDLAEERRLILVANKCDLPAHPRLDLPPGVSPVMLSARTGDGLAALYDRLESAVWEQPHGGEPDVAVSARHGRLLDEAVTHVEQALVLLPDDQLEILSVSVRSALDCLGQITGRTAEPDLLETIFSRFCIGK